MDDSIQNKTIIHERSTDMITKLVIALILGALLAVLNLVIAHLIHLSPINSILILSSEIALYAILLILISRPTKIRIIKKTEVKTIPQTITPTVIKEPENKSLGIPKYDFIGSIKTHTYHKRTCRLSKLVKKKDKISNNDELYFVRNKFKPCKICIKLKNK